MGPIRGHKPGVVTSYFFKNMRFSQYINFSYFSATQPLIFLKYYVYFFFFFGGGGGGGWGRWGRGWMGQLNFVHMIGWYAEKNSDCS